MAIDSLERIKELEEAQRATLNILEDFNEEKVKLGQLQQATMNLLEDVEVERGKFREIQLATMNVLEDFDEEKAKFQSIQKATLNLLEDVNIERIGLEEAQRALTNILDDIEVERSRVEQAKVLLEAANKELEAFSYSVSHDLQAPLRAISGFSKAVLEDYSPRLDAEGQRYLALIQENAHKMGQLINDLLLFSRLGRQSMGEVEIINMEAMVRDVFEELRVTAQERHVQFTLNPLPEVQGNPAMIHQVFMNLLSNALKFTRPREISVIEVGFKTGLDEGAYYIKDNGVGFDMQYAKNLFGVFQRLHTVEEFEGTGVGLALVSRIIFRHGGRVWVEAAVDKGATVWFTLKGVAK